MAFSWRWEKAGKAFASYGNAAHWAIAEGMDVLARETAQNSNDAMIDSDSVGRIDYTVIRLVGDEKLSFEEAVDWNTLHEHLTVMAESADQAVMAGPLKQHLEQHAAAEDLLLLRIDDYGAAGLGGPEFPDSETLEADFGNFIKLLRTDLFSGKAKASGGSYGLGKSVYWAFSRFRTAIFASVPHGGRWSAGDQRVLGVSQGLNHILDGERFDGRGFFGVEEATDPEGPLSSGSASASVLEEMLLRRDDPRPGTSVLIVGFHDPSEPTQGIDDLMAGLKDGIERNFWPLLTRERVEINLSMIDGGRKESVPLQPERTYGDLVRALRRFDSGDLDEALAAPGDVVVRQIPVAVSRKVSDPQHPEFVHHASLVVTLSDDTADTLENQTSLFRAPEMVVETLSKEYPGKVYHAFLVAGRAIRPDAPTDEDGNADDFLRMAEPPSHDRWIPHSGSMDAPRENLRNNYARGFITSLRDIRTAVFKELDGLFNAPPPKNPDGPRSVTKHLAFLIQGPPGGNPRKPELSIQSAELDSATGSWVLRVSVDAANRDEGWSFCPVIQFVGDSGTTEVDQLPISGAERCTIVGDRIVMRHSGRGRRRIASFTLRSNPSRHPIPAQSAAVTVAVKRLGDARIAGGA